MAKKKKTKKSKPKKKDRLTLLAEAAEELNEKLGLEPAIDTEDADEAELEAKLAEAGEMIVPEDNISKSTQSILDEIMPEEDEEEPEEVEDEVEDEEEEDDEEEAEEETDLEELFEEIEDTDKRVDLTEIANREDVFEDFRKTMNKLRTGKQLKAGMLKFLNSALNEEEPEDEEEPEEVEETSKTKEEKPAKKSKKSSKKSEAKSDNSGKKKKKGRGVIATIAQTIEDSGKKGVTKDEILAVLVEKFPNREADSMSNTINVQVPNRISKERFEVENNDGRYRKK